MKELGAQLDRTGRLLVRIDEDSSSLYERLLDSILDAVNFVDAERKITYWN